MNQPTCADCLRPLIQQRVWLDATTEQLTAWVDAGCRMLKGHGRCNGCYQKAYRRRELPAPVFREKVSAVACRRCGIRNAASLCGDCTDVVAELDETARWVA